MAFLDKPNPQWNARTSSAEGEAQGSANTSPSLSEHICRAGGPAVCRTNWSRLILWDLSFNFFLQGCCWNGHISFFNQNIVVLQCCYVLSQEFLEHTRNRGHILLELYHIEVRNFKWRGKSPVVLTHSLYVNNFVTCYFELLWDTIELFQVLIF